MSHFLSTPLQCDSVAGPTDILTLGQPETLESQSKALQQGQSSPSPTLGSRREERGTDALRFLLLVSASALELGRQDLMGSPTVWLRQVNSLSLSISVYKMEGDKRLLKCLQGELNGINLVFVNT